MLYFLAGMRQKLNQKLLRHLLKKKGLAAEECHKNNSLGQDQTNNCLLFGYFVHQ